jgi:DNA-binding Lrp family transcriptional regulator
MVNVTDADRALIALLREDARASVADLARRLGVSRTTAQSRLERLERNGVIAGYAVKLGDAYERGLVRAHMLVTTEPKLAQKLVAELGAIPEVRTLHSISGSYDMIVIVEAPSIEELDLLLDRIGAIEGVDRTMSSIILSTRIDR